MTIFLLSAELITVFILGCALTYYARAARKLVDCVTNHASCLQNLQKSVLALQEIEIHRKMARRRGSRRFEILSPDMASASWYTSDPLSPYDAATAQEEAAANAAMYAELYPITGGTPIGDRVADALASGAIPIQAAAPAPPRCQCGTLAVRFQPAIGYVCAKHSTTEPWDAQR